MFGAMFGNVLGDMMKQDYASTSPFGLWRDDYDRRAREGEAKYYALNQPSWMVEGARKAGVHPNVLFGSMGAPMRGANTATRPSSGTRGMSTTSKTSASRRMDVLAIENAELQNDTLREGIATSQLARERQGQPTVDPSGNINYGLGGFGGQGGATAYALGEGPPGQQLQRTIIHPPSGAKPHPLAAVPTTPPQTHARKFTYLYGRDGDRIKVYSEAGQADELNQILIYAQESWTAAGKMAKAAGLSFIWDAGRQAYRLVRKATRKRTRSTRQRQMSNQRGAVRRHHYRRMR